LLEPGQQIERYTVEERIGSGGIAEVFRVRHIELGSLHAMKVLALRRADVRRRILREGRVQATLRHPNVVPVTDVIEVDGAPILVMDYVDGPDLAQWLEENTDATSEVCEELFRGIVAGVAEAHRRGMVHRDLKPHNVLLQKTSTGWLPRVADFGLVKAATEGEGIDETRTGTALGTPSYMAPEQVSDAKNVDERADVFSLGCIFYRMMCGRKPFLGDSLLDVLNAVVRADYPHPDEVRPGLPERYLQTIRGTLRPIVDTRIRDCAQLIRVLDGTETLESTEDLMPQPVVDELGPDRVPAAALALFFASVLGSITLVAMGIPVENHEADAHAAADGHAEGVASEHGGAEHADPDTHPSVETEAVPAKPRTGAHSSPCYSKRGRLVGYAQVPDDVGGVGSTWHVVRDRNVRKDYPRKKNRFAMRTKVTCVLEIGDAVKLVDAPIDTGGTGTWLAVYSDRVTPRHE